MKTSEDKEHFYHFVFYFDFVKMPLFIFVDILNLIFFKIVILRKNYCSPRLCGTS